MEIVSYTAARKEMKRLMEKVCDDHVPVIITRQGAAPVVMLSLEDYRSMDETDYLLSNPANAERLRASLKELKDGTAKTHTYRSVQELLDEFDL